MPDSIVIAEPDFAKLVQSRALLTQGYGWGMATVEQCMKWVKDGKDGEPLNPYELLAVLSEVVARQGESIAKLVADVAALRKTQQGHQKRIDGLDSRTIGSAMCGPIATGPLRSRGRPPIRHALPPIPPPIPPLPGDLGDE